MTEFSAVPAYNPVMEKDAAGRDRDNRVTYEIAVLEALRERLRCKEDGQVRHGASPWHGGN
ncbi:MAG: hypothetical protein AW10_03846 [Candidatus Accumulibacter appositus]|uniref:Uncharacterized protein n=1 Tax=Candidatus Accumulibacter appositus TaxID=1454003 RepID=A0A011NQ13_9PROT|nr:MAG: hypothetical protein AW10_03846 [Candidatus Accumulibacter appositus]